MTFPVQSSKLVRRSCWNRINVVDRHTGAMMGGGNTRVILLVLDGFGWAPDGPHNPLSEACIPFISALADRSPPVLLEASGEVVGLPAGQVGNSEVGHLTIGSGRTIPQAAVVIGQAVAADGLRGRLGLTRVFDRAVEAGVDVHVIGIASTGGAHGHIDHIGAVLELADTFGWGDRTFVHAVGDGRDVPARSVIEDLSRLIGRGARISTIVGRKFAMDRSGRTERTASVVAALTGDDGLTPVADWRAAVQEQYDGGATDESMPPIVLDGPRIASGDEIVMTNFRPDGLRQLAAALVESGFSVTTMTKYSDDIAAPVVFDPGVVEDTLAGVVAAAGLTQLHVAEREKFGHVTYLFNGYTQSLQPGERHVLVNSRTDVPSFDRAPEMSARRITDELLAEIATGEADFMVANLANIDSVGHTGDYDAVRRAAEVVDGCVAELAASAREHGVLLVITADHGNGECMREEDGATPHTRHTSNRVPLWVLGLDRELAPAGDLRDIAPTCLHLLGIEPPKAMSGRVL
ncbi:2,3-bisphosphoglycerate-independent phosphoglycerate mutase [Streptomyces parvus]|uniref:2,3-bisphosphoglycerate-independent phosphoglycerate mutase n=1 Tax=Streptomyces parvus TaxID=66428 RepID=UPI0035E309FF